MQIAKVLPERATAPPQPVQMQPSRPTLTGGPSGAGGGVINQPVLQKTSGVEAIGENSERILNKKKLDELVRQVTGGGEGLESGEGLSTDVEDVSIYRLGCRSFAFTCLANFSRYISRFTSLLRILKSLTKLTISQSQSWM